MLAIEEKGMKSRRIRSRSSGNLAFASWHRASSAMLSLSKEKVGLWGGWGGGGGRRERERERRERQRERERERRERAKRKEHTREREREKTEKERLTPRVARLLSSLSPLAHPDEQAC